MRYNTHTHTHTQHAARNTVLVRASVIQQQGRPRGGTTQTPQTQKAGTHNTHTNKRGSNRNRTDGRKKGQDESISHPQEARLIARRAGAVRDRIETLDKGMRVIYFRSAAVDAV